MTSFESCYHNMLSLFGPWCRPEDLTAAIRGQDVLCLDGHRSSCLWSQVCEDGERLEDLNMKWLAALSTDTIISKIHSRVAERPAGMVLLGSTVFQVEGGTSRDFLCPASAFFPSCGFTKFHTVKGKEYLALLEMGCCCTFTALISCQTSTCESVWSLLCWGKPH